MRITFAHAACGTTADMVDSSLLALSRPIDMYYSQITSQLTEVQAEAVLADDGLRHALVSAKAEVARLANAGRLLPLTYKDSKNAREDARMTIFVWHSYVLCCGGRPAGRPNYCLTEHAQTPS